MSVSLECITRHLIAYVPQNYQEYDKCTATLLTVRNEILNFDFATALKRIITLSHPNSIPNPNRKPLFFCLHSLTGTGIFRKKLKDLEVIMCD